ncbi:MAG: hypothetical protein HY225_02045 [Candidatus Vogelbacteria bacterium]|nr:hypothetical protein [Candidatus Vogelbacteria bacterium]
MFSLKRVLLISFSIAVSMVALGIWPEQFSRSANSQVTVCSGQILELNKVSQQISCTSGFYSLHDQIPMSSDGDEISGVVELFGTVNVGRHPYYDVAEHIDRVEKVIKQIKFLADWSDVSSQSDDRVVSVMERIAVLNNERESLYAHLDDSLVDGSITSTQYDFYSSQWIAPTWKGLASASSGLDQAINNRTFAK